MEIITGLLSWSNVLPALLFGLLFLVFCEIFRYISPGTRLPPGPTPWPLVGNLPQLLKEPFKAIREVKNYGEISTVYMGRKPALVLNKLPIIKEAMVQNSVVFAGRPPLPVIDWITNGYGILMAAYGHSWKQQRKFSLLTLKNFGLGKKSLEERVREESTFLIEELERAGENAVNPKQVIQHTVSNIICSIVFGERYEYTDKRFNYLLDLIAENTMLVGSPLGMIFNLVPFIKHFPGPHQKINDNAEELKNFIREMVKQHRDTLDRDNIRDFIDAYLVEMERQESSPDSTFVEDNLVMTVADLFLAGTDTTSNTLMWGLIYMMEHPDIQAKCHEEIVRVLGFDRTPSMDDRAELPYTYATVHEIQRVANITPLAINHETTQATQLRGYHIPKGMDIIINLTAVLSDKDHWKHPDTFNPDNFLDEKGQFCRNEAFLPFSLGARVCLGEQLAKMELFVFFSALMQRLSFSWPGPERPDMDGIFSLIRSSHPYTTRCRRLDT